MNEQRAALPVDTGATPRRIAQGWRYGAGWRLCLALALSVLAGVMQMSAGPRQTVQATGSGTWTPTGSLMTASGAGAAFLLPSGQVLALNGEHADLYTPASGTWAPTGSLTTVRSAASLTQLADGRVLVVGGFNQAGVLSSAEVYDPSTGMWASTGTLPTARTDQVAARLADGRVLIAGGSDATGFVGHSAEIYDPTTGSWSSTGSMQVARRDAAAVTLPNGQVLVAGGIGASFPYHAIASAELYTPSTGTWTITGRMSVSRVGQTLSLLPNGQVLAAGGSGTPFPGHPLASGEVYNPSTGTWSSAKQMATARYGASAMLLPNGQVLETGGINTHGTVASAELYDPTANSWSTTGSMAVSRAMFGATLLPNGTVLVAGGESSGSPTGRLTGAEIYTPAS